MVIDRSREKVVVMGSPEGGVEIEEVAARSPEKIIKEHVDISLGVQPYQCRKIAYFMGLEGGAVRQAVSFISVPLPGVYRKGLFPCGDKPPCSYLRRNHSGA